MKNRIVQALARRNFIQKVLGMIAAVMAFLPAQLFSKTAVSKFAAENVAEAAYLGEIRAFPLSFAPAGWLKCEGQTLVINQNTALFSILGTKYGGNGTTNFGIPDLRGRMPMHPTNNTNVGITGGAETHTLTIGELPQHNHAFKGASGIGTSPNPANALPAAGAEGMNLYASTIDEQMLSSALSNVGSSQAHNNMPPYLTFTFCICVDGIYPSSS